MSRLCPPELPQPRTLLLGLFPQCGCARTLLTRLYSSGRELGESPTAVQAALVLCFCPCYPSWISYSWNNWICLQACMQVLAFTFSFQQPCCGFPDASLQYPPHPTCSWPVSQCFLPALLLIPDQQHPGAPLAAVPVPTTKVKYAWVVFLTKPGFPKTSAVVAFLSMQGFSPLECFRRRRNISSMFTRSFNCGFPGCPTLTFFYAKQWFNFIFCLDVWKHNPVKSTVLQSKASFSLLSCFIFLSSRKAVKNQWFCFKFKL